MLEYELPYPSVSDIYHPRADDEFYQSARFYEARSAGLGWRFVRVVQEAEIRIAQHPEAFPVLEGEIRKCVLQDFPYNVLFGTDGDHIFVVAVAHQHRRPGYWRRRVNRRLASPVVRRRN